MRRVLMSFVSITAAVVFLSGCETRTNQYTFSKANVSQVQVMQDADRLKGTSGVDNVLTSVDSHGNATLQVYLDQDKELPGMLRAMEELGYHLVTP